MESDEQLSELAEKELANSPRQELLVKSMTEAGGDEAKGKALYVERRVKELQEDLLEDLLVDKTSIALGMLFADDEEEDED